MTISHETPRSPAPAATPRETPANVPEEWSSRWPRVNGLWAGSRQPDRFANTASASSHFGTRPLDGSRGPTKLGTGPRSVLVSEGAPLSPQISSIPSGRSCDLCNPPNRRSITHHTSPGDLRGIRGMQIRFPPGLLSSQPQTRASPSIRPSPPDSHISPCRDKSPTSVCVTLSGGGERVERAFRVAGLVRQYLPTP